MISASFVPGRSDNGWALNILTIERDLFYYSAINRDDCRHLLPDYVESIHTEHKLLHSYH